MTKRDFYMMGSIVVPNYRNNGEEGVFVPGADRNNPDTVRAHYYMEVDDGYAPMCGYGYNRSNGTSFSILRGYVSALGECKRCLKNIEMKCEPIKNSWPHKTRWL